MLGKGELSKDKTAHDTNIDKRCNFNLTLVLVPHYPDICNTPNLMCKSKCILYFSQSMSWT